MAALLDHFIDYPRSDIVTRQFPLLTAGPQRVKRVGMGLVGTFKILLLIALGNIQGRRPFTFEATEHYSAPT
jgi:hypothetical protein